jgi:hypothetical protein
MHFALFTQRSALPPLAQVALAALIAIGLGAPATGFAQAPNERWRTIETPHFAVHFDAALEPLARRAGGAAERAYAQLAQHHRPARGRIELVVTDHVDYANGFAYVSPTPRMVIFARPPVDDRTLRFREDWLDLVIQHELVHVFQLDRTRGWWRVAQALFGRQPLLFPNAWAPSWLLEGLAVHYESALGDGGRLEGLTHVPYANAAAVDGALPSFGSWSSASLRFPGGMGAYVWGSLFMRSIEGDPSRGRVERFVERSSARVLPWSFERAARAEFGTTFAAQWRRFADSLARAVAAETPSPTKALTRAAWYARAPRLAADGRVLFVASNGREPTGLYELAPGADTPRRVARRNTLDANVPLADGGVLFAQWEWRDPWRLRSDLWLRDAAGRERQLTHGARLFAPDARAKDGAIVAVQNVAGTTRLVRVSADGAVQPLTGAGLDTNWSAPRWSHDGTRIAATRWVRGGIMSIVVLNSLGRELRTVASARATVDHAAWSADDRTLLFSVNATGTAAVWSADLATGALRRVARGSTSLDEPLAVPGGFVAVETRAAGERLVRGEWPAASAADSGALAQLPAIADAQPSLPAAPVDGAVQRYRPLRQLVPRFWLPMVEASDENRTRYGALIAGSDVVGRHAYAAAMLHEPQRGEQTGELSYRYAGFGLPLVNLSTRQTWDHSTLVDSTRTPVGVLGRRRRFAGGALTLVRQRVRQVASVTAGAELEWRDFVTDPAPLRARLASPLYRQTLTYPSFTASAAWANTKSPILAFGPEDGISLSAGARWRWRSDDAAATRSATYVGTAALYKSVGVIPGASHHVLAVRGAAAVTDDRTNTELEAGGVSGSYAELAPGMVVGDARRTVFVRGFAPGAQIGTRAVGGSAEWRAPLGFPGWGKGFVPFFAQRVSAIFFVDVGAAWCPAGSRANTVPCPTGATVRQWMAATGGELSLDAAVLNYDTPYRLRFGYARPVQGSAFTASPNGSAYFSLGLSF